MKERQLSISLAQISQTDTPSQNLDKMASVINGSGSEVIVFPETQLSGLDKTTSLDKYHAQLADLARSRKLWLVYGSYEKVGDNIYNTARIVDHHGKVRLNYSKIHLWNEDGVTPGIKGKVARTEIGNLGLSICWDVAHPKAIRSLVRQGAEIVFVPSYWFGKEYGTTDVIDKLPLVRAFENQVYIAYCDAFTANGETAARSKICSPLQVLAAAEPQKEQMVTATIELSKLRDWRKTFDSWR